MDINAKIKEYIESHGVRQSFLVQKTGIDREKMSKIINCKRKVTAEELVKIARALDIEINYFFD